jgi:TatD DNase family protein
MPIDRLLIETDAPDQSLPETLNEHPLHDSESGRALNHPANLPAVYRFAAGLLQQSPEVLAAKVEENFLRLFSPRRLPE